MPIIRTAQSVPFSVPGLQVTSLASSTALPIGISRDNSVVFGSANAGATGTANVLYQSTNDGGSWSTVYTFPSGDLITGLREMDDGEALVFTNAAAGSPGNVYRSSGWTASRTAATWTKTFTTVGGYIRGYWSGGHTWSFGDDEISPNTSRIGVINEYGPQTTSSGDQTSRARRVYVTQDSGATWTQVLDLAVRYPGIVNMHVHWSGYDPYWNRLWVLIGDSFTAEGNGKYPILYSDDLGATWTAVTAKAPWYNPSAGLLQSTFAAFLPDSIILGNDNGPGICRIPRRGYRKIGPVDNPIVVGGHTGTSMIALAAHQNRRQPAAPVLMTTQAARPNVQPSIYASLDSGATMVELWAYPGVFGNNVGIVGIFGPTKNGKILTSDVGYNLIVGEIIDPGPNLKVGKGTQTGDGTKTTFTFAHGLGLTPTRFSAWNELPVGTYSVTADATNVIITFSAAPANNASLPFQWRAGL